MSAKVPTALLGAKRDREAVKKASNKWLAVYSDNPLERPASGEEGVAGSIGPGGEAGDIVDPNLAGFWSGGGKGKIRKKMHRMKKGKM